MPTWLTRRASWRGPVTSPLPSTTASSTPRPRVTVGRPSSTTSNSPCGGCAPTPAGYGVDPERVGAYGWSAGGQLAALLGARDTRDLALANADYPSRVACVVDLAGDVDLTAYTLPPALDEVVALLGGTPAEVPARYRDVSPLSWIDARTVPFLVIHGLRDDVVPIEQSRRLVSALRAAGVEVEYTELSGAGHGDLTWSRVGSAALTFLGRHLRPGD